MVGPAVKREAVAHLRTMFQMSERRACSVIAADRTSIRYQFCRPPDTELRCRLRDLANARRRFGYRRLFVLLRQQGEPSGINRIYRLYREEGLTVRRRRVRRRAVGARVPILIEAKVNARWSLDFVHDQFACGRRFRILNVVDDVTRECLAAVCAVKRRRFPVGASPTRRPLQPEATGAGMEVTKCLKPSDSGSRNTVTARVCRPQRE
jgi:putative transposase